MGHKPVLAAAAIDHLVWDRDGLYIDGTIGCGGHAGLILERLSPSGLLWGFDWDRAMLERVSAVLRDASSRLRLFHAPFSRIGEHLASEGIRAHGILLDLGLNSAALDEPDRGFRYSAPDAPLDMRMDRDRLETAGDLLKGCSEDELARIFAELGEARRPRAAARAIVDARVATPLRTSGDLVRVLQRARAVPGGPAELSRIFQALRLRVNRELEDLDLFLEGVSEWLVPRGRLVVISYESLSDRRVKSLQRPTGEAGGHARFRKLTPHVLRPDRDETLDNPRARSAKLRALERMD
jgi:16S rRNA (cytosine1402-N4)-methyltransferase